MPDNTSTQSTERKSVISKGRLFSFLIAIFLIVAEVIYYILFSGKASNFGGAETFFIPKFLIEPFTFAATVLGSMTFYAISLPVLGLLISFIISLSITLSILIKKTGIRNIFRFIGIGFIVLYIILMFSGTLQIDIGLIVIFIALTLVSFQFPFKKLIVVGILVLGWGFSAILGTLSPYLNEKEIKQFYRLNENPEATFILKFDKEVSGVLHIVDAVQTIPKAGMDNLSDYIGVTEAISRETRAKPENFQAIDIDFSEYSKVQIVNVSNLTPYSEYWYYIEAWSEENKKGNYYCTNKTTFYTLTLATEDEHPPYIADADINVQPLDIDFSEFVRDNYDKITDAVRTGSGQYAITLGEMWGILEGETKAERDKSHKFYQLMKDNADDVLSIIPSKEAVNKDTANKFMEKIIDLIKGQTVNPNLAEDLKIPAKVKMVIKFDEPAKGSLSITVKKNKKPLRAHSFGEYSYKWEAEFGLMDFQYQGLRKDVDIDKYDIGAYTEEDPEDFDKYIEAYQSDPIKFNVRAYIDSEMKDTDVKVLLERKYAYSIKTEDKYKNPGNFSRHNEKGIQSNITLPDTSEIISIIFTVIMFVIVMIVVLLRINTMKKKFMLRESLPGFLGSLGILIFIINIIVSLALGWYPIRLDFFILVLIVFLLLSEQGWTLKFSSVISASIVIISLLTILSLAFPEVKHSFTPPIDPNVPSTFVVVSHTSLITSVFAFILVFSIVSNMLINNLGLKKKMIIGWICAIVTLIIAIVSGLISSYINLWGDFFGLFTANLDFINGDLFRNIALIFGSAFVGTLIGINVKGDWGKSVGNFLLPLIIVGSVVFIVMSFVPFKLALVLLVASFLIIGTVWARPVTFIYFFLQAFIQIFTAIILVAEADYTIEIKIYLMLLGLAYLLMGLFTIKSIKVRDYSEGKL